MINEHILYLDQRVTSFGIYNNFCANLSRYYQENGPHCSPPTISFSNVERIDPLATTLLITIGLVLRSYHHQPIPLHIVYNPDLNGYLEHIGFFRLTKKNIFIIDENFTGGSSKIYRQKHKIHTYIPDEQYYRLRTIEQQITHRNQLFEALRTVSVPNDYRDVLLDQVYIDQNNIDILLNIFTEIICNAILYSNSTSFALFQTDRYKTAVSISDCGIGFTESLHKKSSHKFMLTNKIHTVFGQKPQHQDFISILEALDYARLADRENLWLLRQFITNHSGVMRIHQNSTQVAFTSGRCANCKKEPYDCYNCILSNYTLNSSISPIRFYKTKLDGVHIEIEFRNGMRDKK